MSADEVAEPLGTVQALADVDPYTNVAMPSPIDGWWLWRCGLGSCPIQGAKPDQQQAGAALLAHSRSWVHRG